MKIGIFDSGLGGLIITNALTKALPQYDYLYLGDTARVPYGNRSPEAVYHFTQEAADYLFAQDCALVIAACNTVSVEATVALQKFDIPNHHPDRVALGIITPTAEAVVALGAKRVGVVATNGTVNSRAYVKAIQKPDPEITVFRQPTPLLVPLVENDGTRWAEPILEHYLKPLQEAHIDSLVLGCTHYPFFKNSIRSILGAKVALISQDEVLPTKISAYLQSHPEVEARLSRGGSVAYCVTDINDSFTQVAHQILAEPVPLTRVRIAKEI